MPWRGLPNQVEEDTATQIGEYSIMAVHVYSIHMAPGGSTHEHIERVRYEDQTSGRREERTVPQMVDFIDRGGKAFTSDGRVRAEIGVVRPGGSARPYIRTYADGRWTNNLLSLPRY